MINLLQQCIQKAMTDCTDLIVPNDFEIIVQPSSRDRLGDYQTTVALQLAKPNRCKPLVLADKIAQTLKKEALFTKVSTAMPGFINLTLENNFLSTQLNARSHDPRLGIKKLLRTETVVVDYSSPNVAKEMHIGHLRSTVIGDAVVRLLEFFGHRVIRRNHVGDWGTQFGMLIEYLLEKDITVTDDLAIAHLNAWYQAAKQKFDRSLDFSDRARKRVQKLQQGDPTSRAIWQRLVVLSKKNFQDIYIQLDVLLKAEDWKGESDYQELMPQVIKDLEKKNKLTYDQGAQVIFLDGFVDRDKKNLPMIVKKSDGSYLYASSDLAAAYDRIHHLHATRLIYLADARQQQHFNMLFAALHQSDWVSDIHRLEHIAFGSVLAKDGKPFKTRSGGTIPLQTLLDEAEKRATRIVQEKTPDLAQKEQQRLGHHLGIGALKYADLRNDSIRDYRFDWDSILSLEGKTAVYLQNAYVRIHALFRKGNLPWKPLQVGISIHSPEEHALAVKLLALEGLLLSIESQISHLYRLCHYLYELAQHFHKFYEYCPIWSLAEESQQYSRLQLSYLTATTLAVGMKLLGIQPIERM